MIDPTNITEPYRTEEELQEFAMFCVMVAGKNSHQQAAKLDAMLSDRYKNPGCEDMRPFEFVTHLIKSDLFEQWLRVHRVGQYRRIGGAFRGLVQYDGHMHAISLEQLESIYGIGQKSSRFYLLHSRLDQRLAVLDTHVLKFMRSLGYDVPKSTPSGKQYNRIEKLFLLECDKADVSPAEFDLQIWTNLSQAA